MVKTRIILGCLLISLLIAGCNDTNNTSNQHPQSSQKKVESLLVGDWHVYPSNAEYSVYHPYSVTSTVLEISTNHIKIYETDEFGYNRSFIMETDCYTENSALYSSDGTKLYDYYQKPLEEYQKHRDEVFDATHDAFEIYQADKPLNLAKKLGGQVFFSISGVSMGLWKNNNP